MIMKLGLDGRDGKLLTDAEKKKLLEVDYEIGLPIPAELSGLITQKVKLMKN